MSDAHDPIRVMRVIARLNIGGPAIHVALLSAWLSDDFETMLVTGVLGGGEGDMADLARGMGVEPVVLPTMGRAISPFDDLRAFFDLLRLMRQYRPHVVHTHTAKAGLLGRLAAWLTRTPVIIHTFHGHVFYGYFSPLKTRVFLWLERWMARLSSVILTISDRLRDELLGFRITTPDKLHVIPLGFDLGAFKAAEDQRGNLKAELGLTPDTPLVGIIGRLVPIKNHEMFIRAAEVVSRQRSDVHFIIVGDGECRTAITTQIETAGLADRIHLTGWRRDLPTIYADLDLLALTSRNEGTPVSIIEALTASVPVVSTEVGGVADLLDGGRWGALVPSDEVDALAAAMLACIETPPIPEAREAARAVMLDRYDGGRLVRDIEQLYRAYLP